MGVVAGLISAGSSLYGSYKKKKAAKKANEAMLDAQVDPDKVASDARAQAIQNARDSMALEMELTPENAQFRRSSLQALQPLVGQTGDAEQITEVDTLIDAGGTADQSDLLTESIAEARRQLALGGTLDSDTRNEVARRAISRGGNTGAARYTSPRDLGLTSLQLSTDRLERGGRFGQVDQNRNQQSFDNLNRLRELRDRLRTGGQGRAMQLAGFGQALQAPDVGLSPGEYAGLAIGNQNIVSQAGVQKATADAQNAQNMAEVVSGIGGIGGSIDWSKVGSFFSKI